MSSFVLPLLAAVVLSTPAAAEDAQQGRVVVFGSSSMNDSFGHLISEDLARSGYQVTRKGVAAAGFSRPDYRDVFEVAKAVSIDNHTELFVVYLGMNDAQAYYLRPSERGDGGAARIPWSDEARWSAAYRARAKDFLEGLCARGAKKVAVLLPVDVKSPGMQKRLERIRADQRAAAADVACATAISTGGDVGNFGAGKSARRGADGVHMSAAGARVIWTRIKSEVLGLTAS